MVDATRTVQDAFNALGMGSATDPALIVDTLDDMQLTDFVVADPAVAKVLDRYRHEPVSVEAVLERLERTLVERYPMIVEFLATALRMGWLEPFSNMRRTLHMGVVVDVLTRAMLENLEFTEAIRAHILTRRRVHGISSGKPIATFFHTWRATGRLFLAAKIMTVDPALSWYIFQRKHGKSSPATIRALYRAGQLTFMEYESLRTSKHRQHQHDGLLLNILEAGTTEYRAGYHDNALAAHVLMLELERHPLAVDGEGRVAPLPLEWISLYESWNAAFLLGDVDDFPLIIPKLFVPSVLDAQPQDYIAARTYSLWLTINTLLFRRIARKPVILHSDQVREAASAWGDINRVHTLRFAQSHLGMTEHELMHDFEHGYRWPRSAFLWFVFSSLADKR